MNKIFNIIKNSFPKDNDFIKCLAGYFILKAETETIHEQNKTKNGFVYFLKDSELYKIGSTINNPKSRANALKVGNARAKLIGYIKTADCRLLEKIIHEKYSKRRDKGEWFKLSLSTVKEIIKSNNGKLIRN